MRVKKTIAGEPRHIKSIAVYLAITLERLVEDSVGDYRGMSSLFEADLVSPAYATKLRYHASVVPDLLS